MFQLIDAVIVTPIINILFVINNFISDFGLSILVFTILVKFLTWPLMKKQLVQAKLIKKLQPELAKIKQNCKGNRQLESLQMLALYKRYNVKPFRSMLMTFIQIPIFIALFTAVNVMVSPLSRDNVNKRAYPFISQNLPATKSIIEAQNAYLSDPEHNHYNFHPTLFGVVNLDAKAGFNNSNSLIILFFCLATTFLQYLLINQQRATAKPSRSLKQIFTEAADGKEADQAEINSLVMGQMSKIMPLMLLSVMVNFPGALIFYYFINSSISLFQQKRIFAQSQIAMEISADQKLLKDFNQIQEAQIVSPAKNKNSKTKVTRISAGNSKRRKK